MCLTRFACCEAERVRFGLNMPFFLSVLLASIPRDVEIVANGADLRVVVVVAVSQLCRVRPRRAARDGNIW